MPDARLYDTDFYAWTQEQAAALRRMAERRANTELDLEHLAEEVADLGDSKRDALTSSLSRIIEHLLKLEHSPAADPRRKWRLSVGEHRVRAQEIMEDNGSLRRMTPDLVPKAWRSARKLTVQALELYDGLDPAALPAECPYTLEQILDDAFWSASRHGLT